MSQSMSYSWWGLTSPFILFKEVYQIDFIFPILTPLNAFPVLWKDMAILYVAFGGYFLHKVTHGHYVLNTEFTKLENIYPRTTDITCSFTSKPLFSPSSFVSSMSIAYIQYFKLCLLFLRSCENPQYSTKNLTLGYFTEGHPYLFIKYVFTART